MREIATLLLVLVLVMTSCVALPSSVKAISGTITVPEETLTASSPANPAPNLTPSPTPNSSQSPQLTPQQGTQQSQPTPTVKPSPFPSPFIIAASIVALVAVFGAVLSLYLRKRGKTKTVRNTTGERFWVIDCYGHR